MPDVVEVEVVRPVTVEVVILRGARGADGADGDGGGGENPAFHHAAVLIFNSDGTQDNNRFNNWGDLQAALVAEEGPKILKLEQSETAPAGVLDLNQATIFGSTIYDSIRLTFSGDSTIINPGIVLAAGGVTLYSDKDFADGPVLTLPGGSVHLTDDAVLTARACEFVLFDSPGPQCILSVRFGSGLVPPSELPTPILDGDYEAVRFTGDGFCAVAEPAGVVNLWDDQVRADVPVYYLPSAMAFPGSEDRGNVQTNAPGWVVVATVPGSRVAIPAGMMPGLSAGAGTLNEKLTAIDEALDGATTPADGSVTTAKIANGAVTAAKLAVPGWQVIHDRTLGATSASETFALTGTMWRIRVMGRVTTTAAGTVGLRATLNGDTGANYSSAGAAATTSLAVSNITASNTNTDRPSVIDLDLAHRSGHWTAGHSIPLVVASNATLSPGAANPQPHVWRSTAPPTSLELFLSTSTFVAGTRFIVEAMA